MSDSVQIGNVFGKLCIHEFSHVNRNYQKFWKVLCVDCGAQKIVREDWIIRVGKCSNLICNSKYRNLIGKVFGNIKIVSYVGTSKNRTMWIGECTVCGSRVGPMSKSRISIRKFCDNPICNGSVKNIKDQKFGRLHVLRFYETRKRKNSSSSYWICRCLECGNETYPIRSDRIIKNIYGCGCVKKASENKLKYILQSIYKSSKIEQSFRGFNWLRNDETGYPLEIDLYIPDISLAVEYDGEQHFFPVRFGGMTKEDAIINFEYIRKLDLIKDEKINNNDNIKYFIRFNYTEKHNLNNEYVCNKLKLIGCPIK